MKNGKIFGKINIIDLIIIVVAVLAVIGIGVRMAKFSENHVAKTTPIEYVVRIEGVRDYSVKALEKGGSVFSEKEGKYIGEIINVKYENDKVDLTMADGERKFIERPNRYVAYVTLKADCAYQNGRYLDAEEIQIGIGKEYKICSKYVSTNGTVVSFKVVE